MKHAKRMMKRADVLPNVLFPNLFVSEVPKTNRVRFCYTLAIWNVQNSFFNRICPEEMFSVS